MNRNPDVHHGLGYLARMRWGRAIGGLLGLVAACGSPAASPPPPTRVDPLAAIVTEARVRDVCGSEHEALLRRLVPDAFACGPHTQLSYVVARSSAGSVLAIAGRQPGDARDPRERGLGVVLVDGQPAQAVPMGTPSSEVDRQALALAAVLLEMQEPRVAIDDPSAIAIVPAAARIYFEGRHVPDPSPERVSVLVARSLNGVVHDDVSLERRRVTIDAVGRVAIASGAEAVLTSWGTGSVCAAHLEALALGTPLDTVASPRVLCGDGQEAAVRMRMPALPGCDRIAQAHYLAARATSDPTSTVPAHATEMVVVVWGPDASERSVLDQGCVGTSLGGGFVNGDDDVQAMLEAAILMARGGTDYATSARPIPASVPAAVRARLSRVSLEAGPGERIAVAWPRREGEPMLRYRARWDEYRMFPVYVYELHARGETMIVDPYEGMPLGALDGL